MEPITNPFIPEGVVVKTSDTFFCAKDVSYKSLQSVPENLTMIIPDDKPHCKHQEPFNCCAEWAVWGENGSVIQPRLIPDEVVPLLRFGYPKSKEKPLRINSKRSCVGSKYSCNPAFVGGIRNDF